MKPSASFHGPLIVCGMHRSGTSYTASLFHSAGVHLGDDLLGANVGNDVGHFEDLGILGFHMRALRALGLGAEGFTTQSVTGLPTAFEHEARRLIRERSREGRVWGWKEPRTVLFLDLWRRVVPQAKYVFVFRRPWEVVDSLFRRGDDVFAFNPALAVHVWSNYNKKIVHFVRRRPQDCVVFEISQVIRDQAAAVDLVSQRFGVPMHPPAAEFRPDLFHVTDEPARARLTWAICPEAREIYGRLRELAGCKAGALPGVPTISQVAVPAVGEWCRATRAEIDAAAIHADAAALRREKQSLRDEMAGMRTELDRLAAALAVAEQTRDRLAEDLRASGATCEALAAALAAEREQLQTAVAERVAAESAAREGLASLDALKTETTRAEEKLRNMEAALRASEAGSSAAVQSLEQASRVWSALERSIHAVGAACETLREECRMLGHQHDLDDQARQLLGELVTMHQEMQRQTAGFCLSDAWRKLMGRVVRQPAVPERLDDEAEPAAGAKPMSTLDAA